MPESYLTVTEADRSRFEALYNDYRMQTEDPARCRPMIIVNTPVTGLPTWEQRLADPMVMLHAELDALRPHLEIGDDRVPTVRVQFGTAQVAAAFGCSMFLPENNLPAAGNHVLAQAEDVHELTIPALDAGWYGKLAEWTDLWKENLPDGIHIQHPDIQSAFNSAHLIRGNDILTDFYDSPELVEALLGKVTEFMIAITRHTKAMISPDPDWFFDWGSMWKGRTRISNCSMQMISPELYRKHVLPWDARFFEAIGGGRMHYCGITGGIIDDFFNVPSITGLDVDCGIHDFFALCERAPSHCVLTPTGAFSGTSLVIKRLLRGDWPAKRNIIVPVSTTSIEEGKRLLERLHKSMPY
ncbi:MAG: uroporphyrinogen decarboxylase family protein [Lentisphaeria bacterium]|nr:uroporphyrinogen decarboxylase family protein [Lentisphaeria bacterium]